MYVNDEPERLWTEETIARLLHWQQSTLNMLTTGSSIYRMAHEKPARRLVDQRGHRFRTLYKKLNKCKCKVLTG